MSVTIIAATPGSEQEVGISGPLAACWNCHALAPLTQIEASHARTGVSLCAECERIRAFERCPRCLRPVALLDLVTHHDGEICQRCVAWEEV